MEDSSGPPTNEDVSGADVSKQDSNRELWLELAALRRRVETLEGSVPPSLAASRLPEALARAAFVPQAPVPVSEAAPVGRLSSLESRPSSLESKIGAQIFNRVGVFAVLAGAAWFLKLAIDRAWIGPGLRVVVGLVVAVGLVVWSERFRRSGAVAFSYTLKALGAGIAYLSLWAAFSLYHLLPGPVVLAAMVAITVTNAVLAWRQDSELLAALALAGGLATPGLLSTGGDRELFLFGYLLLLDLGAVALTVLRPWPGLAIGAFAGTTIYYGSWRLRYAAPDNLMACGVFVALIFFLFSALPLAALGWRRSTDGLSRYSLLRGLPVAVGICACVEVENLLSGTAFSGGIPWVIAGLALVYLGLTFLGLTLFAEAFSEGSIDYAASTVTLDVIHLGMAVGLFALAGLLKFDGYGIALCWIAELVMLVVTATPIGAHRLAGPLRAYSAIVLLLSFGALVLLDWYDRQPDGSEAFANMHFATYLAGLVGFAVVAVLSLKMAGASNGVAERTSGRESLNLSSPVFLGGFAVIAFNVVAVLSVSLQIDRYWWHEFALRHAGVVHRLYWYPQPAYVDFVYSAWFMLYGAALMAVGFWRGSAFLRWQALFLLTLSIGKVFLFDTSHLNEGYRVASFLGLGVLLLTVSFAYQRDWLGLKRVG